MCYESWTSMASCLGFSSVTGDYKVFFYLAILVQVLCTGKNLKKLFFNKGTKMYPALKAIQDVTHV